MGDNQKRIKVSVASTNNEFTLVTGELIAGVRDVLLDQRRADIAATTGRRCQKTISAERWNA